MKIYLIIAMVVVSSNSLIYSEEIIQKTGVGITIDAGGDGDDVEEDNFVWIGPGWYGGHWFNHEDDFNHWHRGGWRDERRNEYHDRRHDR